MKPKPAPATPAATSLNANQRALREAKIARKYASSMVEGLVKRNIIGRYFADKADARDAIADAIKNAIHEAASPVAVLDSEFKRGDEVWIRGKVMDAYDNNPIYVSPYCVSNSTGTIGIEDLADIRHAVAMNDETPQNLQPAAAQPQRESEQPDWDHVIVWELRPETGKGSGDQICLERRDGFKGRRWAITKRGFVLNKLGEWEYEPIPSSRTEEWLETVRWETPEAARAALSPQTGSTQRKN